MNGNLAKLSQSAIWDTADKFLRSVVPRQEYGDYIIPFLVLRRIECLLADTKRDVVEYARTHESPSPYMRDMAIRQTFGLPFYNVADIDLGSIGDDHVLEAFEEYLDCFSANIADIWESFDLHSKARLLARNNRLWQVIRHFSSLDMHPDAMHDTAMGDLFEEIMYRAFSAKGNDAGEFYTPRDAIRLMADLLILPDAEGLQGKAPARSVYDPTAGTGGMLLVAARTMQELNPRVDVTLAGQELKPSAFAIGKADLLIQGGKPDAIQHGNTLREDLFAGRTFDYVMSNPPYGSDWSADADEVKREAEIPGSRFSHGLPSTSDGQMLFLSHVVSKLAPATKNSRGGRAGVVMNGSPLFTGGPGSGPDSIRRWLLTEDLVDAIIALPGSMFFNTGIDTYIWILDQNKDDKRRGKIQLIDASGLWHPMKKPMGEKRREMDGSDRATILRAYEAFTESDISKIVTAGDLGFHDVAVVRPRRLASRVTDAALAQVGKHKAAVDGLDQIVRSIDGTPWNLLPGALKSKAKAAGMKMPVTLIDAIMDAVAHDDPDAPPAIDRRGRPVVQPGTKMTERIPLSEDIDEHMRTEVLPFAPDATWDVDAAKVGYEIPIKRLFFTPEPVRSLEEIDADVKRVMRELSVMFAEVSE